MKDSQEIFRLENTEKNNPATSVVEPMPGPPDLDRMMSSYGDSLMRLCFMYLKDMQLAEDAVQETFLKAYKHYSKFDGGKGEKTWINRIAINVCKDMLRSAWNRRVNVVEQLNDIADERGFGDEADNTLIAAVMELKPRYKEVVLLFYYQDMKIADIAKVLNAPESTISVRLKRARDLLKKQLGGWYYDAETEL